VTLPPLNPALFHLDPDHLWFMHCAEGPVPKAVVREVRNLLHKELWPWEMAWKEDFLGIPAGLRREAARVIGAEHADISLVPSTSAGLVTAAQGLRWSRGDEVVVPLGEFPANVWPWKALDTKGVRFKEVPLWDGQLAGAQAWDSRPPTAGDAPETRLLEGLGPATRVLAVSWVRFQDGLKLDLPTLSAGCRTRKVRLVVDGIQGAGTFLPDLDGVSAFATGGNKGLLGPAGQGFLWTDPAFRADLQPMGSWLSVDEAAGPLGPDTEHRRGWLKDGRRLEQGGLSILGCGGALESLRTLNQAGIPAISNHVRALQARFLDGIRHVPAWEEEAERLRALLEAGRLGSILAFHHGGRGPQGLEAFLARGVRRGVYGSVREGYVRVAIHGWHEAADIARAVDWFT
jgi:cysteine desulfurase / selenocysteine lyase